MADTRGRSGGFLLQDDLPDLLMLASDGQHAGRHRVEKRRREEQRLRKWT
jgi:hypothetical protein